MRLRNQEVTPYLLVKKAMTGKPGSWESVKTFWMKRLGWQLCCGAESQAERRYCDVTRLAKLLISLTYVQEAAHVSLLAGVQKTNVPRLRRRRPSPTRLGAVNAVRPVRRHLTVLLFKMSMS